MGSLPALQPVQVQPPDIANALATRYQLQQMQQKQASQNALMQAGPGLVSGDDKQFQNSLSTLSQYDPQTALQLQSSHAAQKKAASDLQWDQLSKSAQVYGAISQLPDDQIVSGAQQALAIAKSHGADTSQIEPIVASGDPAKIRQFVTLAGNVATTRADQLKQSNDDRDYSFNVTKFGAEEKDKAASRAIEQQNANKPISMSPGSVLVNPRSGQQIGGNGQLPGAGQTNLTGDAYLQTLPTEVANQVKAVSEGRAPYPQGFNAKTPLGQAVLNALPVFDPQFEAGNYTSRMKTRTDFMGGGKSAQNVKALNTAIGHAGRLFDQIGDTASGNFTPLNAVENKITDLTGGAGPQNFRQTAAALASELTTVFRGSGGAEADVVRQLDGLSENASSEQKKAAVRNAIDLLNSRLSALHDQYTSGMGTMQTPYQFVSDKSKAVLSRIGDEPTPGQGGANAPRASGAVIHYDANGNRVP